MTTVVKFFYHCWFYDAGNDKKWGSKDGDTENYELSARFVSYINKDLKFYIVSVSLCVIILAQNVELMMVMNFMWPPAKL